MDKDEILELFIIVCAPVTLLASFFCGYIGIIGLVALVIAWLLSEL